MTTSRRRILLAALLIGFAACFGCNPALFPLFLKGEAQDEATIKRLALEDKSKEVKVAVVVSASRLDARQEVRNVSRDLGRKTVEQLRTVAKANDDKLTVIDATKVQMFLDDQPHWKSLDYDELADKLKKKFKVDFVIDVEIDSMSLYEQGNHELFRGRADLHVKLLNAVDPDDNGNEKDIHALYPNEQAGPVAVDSDTNIFDFRDKFLGVLAKKIVYCFCSHPTINQMDVDRPGMGE
jgi:hypothetical protein